MSAPYPKAPQSRSKGSAGKTRYGSGKGGDAIGSGLEVIWTQTPTKWSNHFFENLFNNEWELTKSPAGAHQWKAKGSATTIPDAHDPSKRHVPTMLTTDLSLRFDPAYEKISRRFYEHPDQFADAFARAWFKLTHRDMGPIARYLGPLVPKETLPWQDPIPAVDHPLIGEQDIAALKAKILASGLSVSQLVSTAWASASTFRGSDKRGGANGARIRLAPAEGLGRQPAGSAGEGPSETRSDPKGVQRFAVRRQESFACRPDRSRRLRGDRESREGRRARREGSLHAGAHGCVAGANRCDSFAPLEPTADGFRNYLQRQAALSAEELLVDRAQLLTLTAPEMTVLVGGLRVLDANTGQSKHGVFTKRPER